MDGNGFSITVDRSRWQAVITPVGELDTATCPRPEHTARDVLLQPPQRLVLDLAKVGFCGSTGINTP